MILSIRTTIIVTVIVLFLIGIAVMTTISSIQVKNKTEEAQIDQSIVYIDEMGFAITNFLGQYEKGIQQLIHSRSLTEFLAERNAEDEIEARLVTKQMNDTRDNFHQQGVVVQDTETIFNEISSLMANMQDSIDAVYEGIQKVAAHKDDVTETIQTMAATSQETAAACEEVSASTEEQLRAIQSVTNATETMTNLSEGLSEAVNRFTV